MKKPTVLVVGPDRDLVEMISLILESEFDFHLLTAESCEQALQMVKDQSNLDMVYVVVDNYTSSVDKLYTVAYDQLSIPFILISKNEPKYFKEMKKFHLDHNGNSYIHLPFHFDEVVESYICACRSMTEECHETSLKSSEKSGFSKIRVERFLKWNQSTSAAYIQINQNKFIKVYDGGNPIDREQVEAYSDKGLDFLFLEKAHFEEFVIQSLSRFDSELFNNELDTSGQVRRQFNSEMEIRSAAGNLGISEEVLEKTDETRKIVIKELSRDKNIGKHLTRVVRSEGYIFEHAQLMNFICAGIAHNMNWAMDKTLPKMISAAMLCDAGLENGSLAGIHSLKSVAYMNLPVGYRNQVKNHIRYSLNLLEKSQSFLSEEITILENHHEKPDGSGFPRGLTFNNIPVVSCAFILAHDFTHLMLTSDDPSNIDPNEILEDLGEDYQKGNFAGPYKALLKSLNLLEASLAC